MPQNLEIERKFVVNTSHPEYQKIRSEISGQRLTQSTIHKEAGYKLRIRMIEDIATGVRSSFFCFKVTKKWDKNDPSMRDEYEWPVMDRNALYMMIGHGEVSKLRREWDDPAGLHWAIDEYEWSNEWVVTIDVEMHDPKHIFIKPEWCGWEVTNDARLKNSSLQETETAFSTWTEGQKKWYKSLEIGDGVSVWPIGEEKIEKKTFFQRLKKAWKILKGKE